MPSVYLVADTHFGHAGVCRFLRPDGTKLRPWNSPEDMDKDMVEYWNDTVGPKDKVYHLGDVVINRKSLAILHKLHGDKVLIKGNHDIFKLEEYSRYFRDIRAYWIMDGYVLSHIPIHPSSLERWKGNFHGHLHANQLDDPRYMCVSVEHTNYKPILFERAREKFLENVGTKAISRSIQ